VNTGRLKGFSECYFCFQNIIINVHTATAITKSYAQAIFHHHWRSTDTPVS